MKRIDTPKVFAPAREPSSDLYEAARWLSDQFGLIASSAEEAAARRAQRRGRADAEGDEPIS